MIKVLGMVPTADVFPSLNVVEIAFVVCDTHVTVDVAKSESGCATVAHRAALRYQARVSRREERLEKGLTSRNWSLTGSQI